MTNASMSLGGPEYWLQTSRGVMSQRFDSALGAPLLFFFCCKNGAYSFVRITRKEASEVGLEPTISPLGGERLIH